MGTVVTTVLGTLLIGLALHDIWHTLLRPVNSGHLSRLLMRCGWKLLSTTLPNRLALTSAGPLLYIATILSWVTLLVFGWDLVYWPHMPESFLYSDARLLDNPAFAESLRLSIVTLSTLGFGDVTAETTWLRILVPVQSLLGFALLSSSISWLLSLYSCLVRRRLLGAAHAPALGAIVDAIEKSGEPVRSFFDPSFVSLLTERLAAVESDLIHFPVSYYFWADDDRFTVDAVRALAFVVEHWDETGDPNLDARVHGLSDALDRFLTTVNRGFQDSTKGRQDIIATFAVDRSSRGWAGESERGANPAAPAKSD